MLFQSGETVLIDVRIHIYCADAQMNVMVILAIRPRCAGSIIREGRTDPMKPPWGLDTGGGEWIVGFGLKRSGLA